MTSSAMPIVVLDDAPKSLGLSSIRRPFSRTWAKDKSLTQIIVSSTLSEFDPRYRARAKKMMVDGDKSFGGALKRLRLQEGLRRGDFEPALSAKTIARIERNEVARPRGRTLAALAKKLGVKPEHLATF